jgi:hypothetical protein
MPLPGAPRFHSLRSADDAPRDGWPTVLGDLLGLACVVIPPLALLCLPGW